MLVPRHPQPVSRRREVAAVVVTARQAATIAPGHVLRVAAAPAPAAVPQTTAPSAPPPALSRHDDDTPV